jgi:hypothetical protein
VCVHVILLLALLRLAFPLVIHYETPQIHVSTGIFLRDAPPNMVLYKDYGTIIFKINFGFTEKSNFAHHLLLSSCTYPNATTNPTCITALPLLTNLQTIGDKLEFLHNALNNRAAPRDRDQVTFNDPPGPVTSAQPPSPFSPTPTSNLIRQPSSSPETFISSEEIDGSPITLPFLISNITAPQDEGENGWVSDNARERRKRSTNNRHPRQLFLGGLAAGFVTSKIFDYFGNSDIDTEKMYKTLSQGINQNQLHLIQKAKSVNLYKVDTERVLNLVAKEINALTAEFSDTASHIYSQLENGEIRQLLLLADSLQEQMRTIELFQFSTILSACAASKLPSTAVRPLILQRELSQFAIGLTNSSFELVMDLSDISPYYHHGLTQCNFNQRKVEVVITLNVPIKPIATKYQMVETISVPFLHITPDDTPNQFCHMDISHQFVILETTGNQTNVIPIDPANLSSCSIDKGICFYSDLYSTPKTATDCMKNLLEGRISNSIHEVCPFNCRSASPGEVSIISLTSQPNLDKVYAISNAANDTRIVCRDASGSITSEQQLYATHQVGSYFVSISNCLYSIELADRSIRIPHPCRINANLTNTVRLIIPSRWTSLSKELIVKARTVEKELRLLPAYKNVSEIYNPLWKQSAIVIDSSWQLKIMFMTKFHQHEERFSSDIV